MLDIHMLTHPVYDTSRNVEALKEKLSRYEEINLHVLPGVEGHIGEGRFRGFSLGNSPYVAFIDDDDDVSPAEVIYALDTLRALPTADGIVTRERRTGRGPATYSPKHPHLATYDLKMCRQMHHVVIVRRASIAPYLERLRAWPNGCEFALWITMLKDGLKFVHCDVIGYNWCQDVEKGAHKNLKASSEVCDLINEMMDA